MLVPTSPFLILSQDKKSESLNTIKIDFARISHIKSTKQNYTQCTNCKALLTIEDKKYISCKNTDEENKIIWNCRFCKKQNKNSSIYFVSSNFKYFLSKNESTKIVPPIILFLIDISGSMTSSIYTDIFTNSKQKNQKNPSIITTQMRKIIEESVMRKNQILYLAELQKSFGNQNDLQENIEHFSKLSFLFSIIEYHLKKLRSVKQKSQFRVGFVFFSDSLVVLKGSKQKSIPMYVDLGTQEQEIYPYKKQSIDFNNYQNLYKKGKSYERYFGDSKFSNFDISKLAVQYIKTGGKTALGPALAFASGIISQHDQGSKVIVLTDSLPNYGILSSKESRVCYKQIASAFEQSKSTMGIFRLLTSEYEKKNFNSQFEQFIKNNSQIVKLIQISIMPQITEQVLQNTIKSLKNLITHETIGDSHSLTILNDNQKIQLTKFKYDNIDFRNLRFITSQSKNWIQCNIDKKKLQESDWLFPTMTQIVIQYNDIFTKQRYLFMSYTQQKLFKAVFKNDKFFPNSQIESSQDYFDEILEQVNLDNIQTLFDMQCLKAFQQQRETEAYIKRTYRMELKNQTFKLFNHFQIKSIDCKSINDYTQLQNKINDQSANTKIKNQRNKQNQQQFCQIDEEYEFL